ncbi:MAG: hypothetical protein ACI9H6_000816 [Patiriisocius sp.]|jgi:hypothetical protein
MNFLNKDLTIVVIGAVVLVAIILKHVPPDIGISLLTLSLGSIAYFKYSYEKNKDRKTEILDLISFFRKELLPKSFALNHKLEGQDVTNLFMKMDVDDIDLAYEKYPVEFLAQTRLLAPDDMTDEIIDIVNVIEEFSVRVLTLEAEKEDSIAILKSSFVQLTEAVSTYILRERHSTNSLLFINTLELYNLWNR